MVNSDYMKAENIASDNYKYSLVIYLSYAQTTP